MKTLRAICLLLTMGLWPCVAAYADFQREFERFNRQQSFRSVEEMDREIQIQVQEKKKEEGEEEKTPEEEAEEAAREDWESRLMRDESKSQWHVRSAVRTGVERNTNIFERRLDPPQETTYRYIPSVRATTRLADWRYVSDYEMTYVQHKNFHFNDRFEHAWAQELNKKGNKLSIGLANSLSFFGFNVEDPDEKLPDIKTNLFSTEVNYKAFPKLTLTGYYTNQYTEFKNTSLKASGALNDTFGARAAYAWRPRLSVFADYSYRFSRPPKLPESDNINAQQFTVGLRGSLTPKIFLHASAGLESKEFAATDDKLGAVAEAAVTYAYSPGTRFTLLFQRASVPTGTESSGGPLNQAGGFEVAHRLTRQVTLTAGQGIRLSQAPAESTVVDPEPD